MFLTEQCKTITIKGNLNYMSLNVIKKWGVNRLIKNVKIMESLYTMFTL